MDIGTILGVFLGIGLVLFAILQLIFTPETGMLLSDAFIKLLDYFASLPSLLIVLGGSVAATLMSFPLKETLRMFKIIGVVLRKERNDPVSDVRTIVEMSKLYRKSPAELEKFAENITDPFLQDGAKMITQGMNEQMITEIMTTRIDSGAIREKADAKVLNSMGKYAPAFGMIGTLVGLVVMMRGLGEASDNPMEALATGMGVALITTLYGTIIANMLFLPLGEKLDKHVNTTKTLKYMMLEGIILVLQKKHFMLVEEKMNAYLPPRFWVDNEETGDRKK